MLSKNYGCKITRKINRKQRKNRKKDAMRKDCHQFAKILGEAYGGENYRNHNHLFINKLIIKKFFQDFVKSDEKSCNFAPSNMAVVAQLVRVPDCGSVGRRFESDLPPESKAATRDCRCFFCIMQRDSAAHCVRSGMVFIASVSERERMRQKPLMINLLKYIYQT